MSVSSCVWHTVLCGRRRCSCFVDIVMSRVLKVVRSSQIVDIRQIGNAQTTTERFRLVLSDGVHLQQAMLATQLNEKVKNNLAVKGSIVQLLEYICNTVQNRK